MTVRILQGESRERLRELPDRSVHCCVSSPPYFGLRDYGVTGQMGLEATPDEFVAGMVEVFREVRRVLRDDGTLWLNLGDSYVGGGRGGNPPDSPHKKQATSAGSLSVQHRKIEPTDALGSKQLLGIPWRVAFALQSDGWYLRQDIIWSKPNPMPESVRDRCTKAHEYLFLLSKGPRYYFDQKAISEPVAQSTVARLAQDIDGQAGSDRVPGKSNGPMKAKPPRFGGSKYGDDDREESRTKSGNEYSLGDATRNRRSVWEVATQPFSEAHFATFPPALIEPCIKAGCPSGGLVLDPFSGAGTTGLVADRLQRDALLIELNPEYIAIAERRIKAAAGMFADVEIAA